MAITPLERLLAAAKGEMLDRQPCVCPGGMMNMMFKEIMEVSGCKWPEAHIDPALMTGLNVGLYENGGFENYGVPFDLTAEAEAMGAKVDMGDMLYEPHVVVSPLEKVEDWKSLPALDLDQHRFPCILQSIRMLKDRNDGVPVIANITGPVSLCGTLVDMEKLMKAMRKDPENAHGLFDHATEQLVKFVKAAVEAGADGICIHEPSGTGEILGPKFFKEYTVEYLNRVLDAVDTPIKMVHICGKLRRVYDQLADINCNIFSFDALVPVREIKPWLADKAAMGNISTLSMWEVPEKTIRAQVRSAKQAGVAVIAPACGLPTITPLKVIQALVSEAQEVPVCRP